MKIFSKIIISLVLFIFVFSTGILSIVKAEESVWYYNEGPVVKLRSNFKSQIDCENSRTEFLRTNTGLTTDGMCKTTTVSGLPVPEPNDPPVYVDGKIGSTKNESVYKLLAPIGKIVCMDSSGKNPDCIGNNIGTYLNFIFKLGIGLCAALAVIMLIIYGVMYMGDESIFAKTEAKKKMLGAVTGLLIALGAWALLNTINPDLTGVKGFKIDQVGIELENSSQYRLAQTQDTPEAKVFKRTSYYSQIKSIASNNNVPSCLMQVAIQRESGGNPSIGHDEDVPYASVASRRDFIASGKKFDGTTFTPGDKNDAKITQRDFLNTDHPNNYTQAPNLSVNNLGLDWRFSHSVGMFGVTFGPNHLNPDGAKAIYGDPSADITKATSMMKNFYSNCNNDIEGTWRAYNSGKCNGDNSFTNKETAIRLNLYNQCIAQDK